MPTTWSTRSLTRGWTLSPTDLACIGRCQGNARLGFALLLKYFHLVTGFPHAPADIPPGIVTYLASQVGIPAAAWEAYWQQHRLVARHQAQIRTIAGFCCHRPADRAELIAWLIEQIPAIPQQPGMIFWRLADACHARRIAVPPLAWMQAVARTVLHRYDTQTYASVVAHVPAVSQVQVASLVHDGVGPALPLVTLRDLCASPRHRRLHWGDVTQDMARLQWIRDMDLPANLFPAPATPTVQRYAHHVRQQGASKLRHDAPAKRLTLLAAVVRQCEQEITDRLVDDVLEVVTRLTRAGRHAREQPAVAVPGERLTPSAARTHVQVWAMIAAYRGSLRLLTGMLLDTLTFVAPTGEQRQVGAALAWVRHHRAAHREDEVPVELLAPSGLVPQHWRTVLWPDEEENHPQITRLAYEICLLRRLRTLIQHQQLGVVGAARYHLQGAVQDICSPANSSPPPSAAPVQHANGSG